MVALLYLRCNSWPVTNRTKPSTVPGLTVTSSHRHGREGDVAAEFTYSPGIGEWSASGDVVRGIGGLVISRLEIKPSATATGGVTSGLLRRVQVGELLAAVQSQLGIEGFSVGTEVVESAKLDTASLPRGGRSPLSDELLCAVALTYLLETGPGSPAGAMKRMAEQFNRPEETIRTWVARARKSGWLGPSVRGRRGAEPGPQLWSAGYRPDDSLTELNRRLVVEREARYPHGRGNGPV